MIRTTENAAAARQPASNPRDDAVRVLRNETEALKLNWAVSEILGCLRDARNPPCGMPPLERHRRALSILPTVQAIDQLAGEWEAAVSHKPDKRLNRALVGLLIDSFPQSIQGQPESFVEAMLSDLQAGGYAPITVAEALQVVRRTSKFRPTIAEVLERCSAVAEKQLMKKHTFSIIREEREHTAQAFERAKERCEG